MRIVGDVVGAVAQHQSNKAKSELMIGFSIAVIASIIGVVLLGMNVYSKGKNCLLPDFLCKLPLYIHMIILGCIVIGLILHIVSFGMTKALNPEKQSEDEIKKKIKTIDGLKTVGHVLLSPIYLAIIAIGIIIAINLAGN